MDIDEVKKKRMQDFYAFGSVTESAEIYQALEDFICETIDITAKACMVVEPVGKSDGKIGMRKNNSEYWHTLYILINRVMVVDPDGWDRANWKESWGEKITWDEFKRRAMNSTLQGVTEDELIRVYALSSQEEW